MSHGRKIYLVITLGIIAFTIYGSYVPFHYHDMAWEDVIVRFKKAMTDRFIPTSKSDWIANCLLGFPFGFGLLGLLRTGRPTGLVSILIGINVVLLDVLFAATVEFGQLYFPGRTCAGSDVFAQSLGATMGVLIWLLIGQTLDYHVHKALGSNDPRGNSIRWAIVISIYIGFHQLLPLDFTASPAEIYRNIKSRDHSVWVPFSEFTTTDTTALFQQVRKSLELCALFMPLGFVMIRLTGSWITIVGLSLMFAGLTELGQLMVSRRCSMTDAIIASFAVQLSWGIGRGFSNRTGFHLERVLILGQLWILVLAVIHWQPFDVYPKLIDQNLQRISWVPFELQIAKDYARALDEVLMKVVVFVPFGCLIGYYQGWKRSLIQAVMMTGLLSTVLEFGQLMIPDRYCCPTDVMLAIMGGILGSELGRRIVRSVSQDEGCGIPPQAELG